MPPERDGRSGRDKTPASPTGGKDGKLNSTREEKETFGREYRYLAQNKDGLASDWCDAVFRDGREDPSGACEAMADDEKWADATRINMRPPPRAAPARRPIEKHRTLPQRDGGRLVHQHRAADQRRRVVLQRAVD